MSLFRQGTLAQQTSQVFQMTLDELQSSFAAGSGKLGSMNLEEFLAQVWDQHGGPGSEFPQIQPPVSTANAPSMNNGSVDYSGKTVEEVWQAIQDGKNQAGEPKNTVKLGSFLQSVGIDMPSSVSTDLHMTSLSLPSEKIARTWPRIIKGSSSPSHNVQSLQKDTMRMPEEAQMPLIVPQQSGAMPSPGLYYPGRRPSEEFRDLPNGAHASATIQTGPKFDQSKGGRFKRKNDSPFGDIEANGSLASSPQTQRRPRKRKEPEVVDEKTARLQKRMVKNRESAARSRARKQEYTAQLEVQVAALKNENRALVEKILRDCTVTPPQKGSGAPLRRIRTMPTPDLKKLMDDDTPLKENNAYEEGPSQMSLQPQYA